MKTYYIAGIYLNIEFIDQETIKVFAPYEKNTSQLIEQEIIFQLTTAIEPLPSINKTTTEGFKSYTVDGKELFDIEDEQHNVVIRGCFEKNRTTFSFIDSFSEVKEYEYILSYMRFCELSSPLNYLALKASAISLDTSSILIIGENEEFKTRFINKWLQIFNNCCLLSQDKVFIKKWGSIYNIYVTPWSNVLQVSTLEPIKLTHILCLNKKGKNYIQELKESEIPILLASQLNIQNDDHTKEYLADFCVELAESTKVIKYFGKLDDKGIDQIFKKIYFD